MNSIFTLLISEIQKVLKEAIELHIKKKIRLYKNEMLISSINQLPKANVKTVFVNNQGERESITLLPEHNVYNFHLKYPFWIKNKNTENSKNS